MGHDGTGSCHFNLTKAQPQSIGAGRYPGVHGFNDCSTRAKRHPGIFSTWALADAWQQAEVVDELGLIGLSAHSSNDPLRHLEEMSSHHSDMQICCPTPNTSEEENPVNLQISWLILIFPIKKKNNNHHLRLFHATLHFTGQSLGPGPSCKLSMM